MDGWTTSTSVAVAALLLAVLVVLALVGALVRERRTNRALAAEVAATRDDLDARLRALEQPVSPSSEGADLASFVITEVGTEPEPERNGGPAERIEGRLFADLVLRESVVKAASWSYGIRAALSAENRNRVRFEVRRETRRAGKQRKADVKAALREYYANQESRSGRANQESGTGRETR